MTIEITLTSYQAGGDVTMSVHDFHEIEEELGTIDEWIEEMQLTHETLGYDEHYVDRFDY